MFIRHSRTALAVALSIFFQPAFAVVPGDDEAAVVVTATRFSSGIAHAIGATVIDAGDIAQGTATTLGELLDRLGSVTVRRNLSGTEDASIDLRGFGVTGNQNTLVLIDGQRISDNELASARISGIPLAAIERIEILRGGGAVIYGPGATGGVINIVTRAPGREGTRGYLFGQVVSLNTQEARGGVESGNGSSASSLHAGRCSTDNWRDNNKSRNTAASGEARVAFDNGFAALRFAADDQHARLPGARSEAQLASDPRGTATPNDFSDSEARRLALTVEKKLGPFRIGADLTTRRKDADFHYDYGFGMFSDNATRGEENAFSPHAAWSTRWGAVRNVLTVGADWRDHDYQNNGLSDFGFGPTLSAERAEQHNLAYYVQNQTVFPTGTELALGARRERIRQSWREAVTPLPERSVRHALSAWEVALRQDLGAGVAVHAREGLSYRVANVDENRCFFAPCTPLLLPQTSRDTGIGVEWIAGRNRLRAEWFDMRVQDELYFNRLAGFFGSNMNMPPLQRKGVQLDGAWHPLSTLDINASYTRTQARFTEGTFNGVAIAGNEVPIVPRDRATLQLGWQFMPATRFTLAHTYVGSQRYDNDQANRFRYMPAYGLTDVKLSHRWRDVTLSAGINNLFDKAYYSYAIVNNPLAPTTFNAYPEMRRTAYVGAEFKF